MCPPARSPSSLNSANRRGAIGRSHATLVNWERGKTKISKSDLVCLLAELRAPVDVRKGLKQLREEAGQGAGQWVVYDLPDWLRPLVSFEEDAVAETTFEPVIVLACRRPRNTLGRHTSPRPMWSRRMRWTGG
jgi:hypothetical protein